jgi:hypothetical protein
MAENAEMLARMSATRMRVPSERLETCCELPIRESAAEYAQVRMPCVGADRFERERPRVHLERLPGYVPDLNLDESI